MSFQWSENAGHIQTLYPAWDEQDGFSESDLTGAEQTLGVHLPFVLRQFYQSWGKRPDMTATVQHLLLPDQLFWHSDGLVFCVENQAVYYWAIPRAYLTHDDPPVDYIYNEPGCAWSASHEYLSVFFDFLTYQHALAGGAVHGGYASTRTHLDGASLLQSHWRAIYLSSYPGGIRPDAGYRTWPLFIQDGCVIDGFFRWSVATRSAAMLEQVGQMLGISWEHVW